MLVFQDTYTPLRYPLPLTGFHGNFSSPREHQRQRRHAHRESVKMPILELLTNILLQRPQLIPQRNSTEHHGHLHDRQILPRTHVFPFCERQKRHTLWRYCLPALRKEFQRPFPVFRVTLDRVRWYTDVNASGDEHLIDLQPAGRRGSWHSSGHGGLKSQSLVDDTF